MRILFSVRKPSNVRHYESVLRALASRGHETDLVREPFGDDEWPPFVLALTNACPGIRLETLPATAKDAWWELAMQFRRARFFLRFLGPAYLNTPALLKRARKRAPRSAVRLAEHFGYPGRWLLGHLLNFLELSTRTLGIYRDFLSKRRPDVVVLTPLVVLKTAQLDLARAAIELGMRNVFAVASWDHLSSKDQLDFAPQQVIVWNETQKREAVEHHHLDPTRISVTGSQVFDEWFDWRPSTTREGFCQRVGLRSDRPLLLYVGSSLLEESPPEPTFVARWARYVRESGYPALRDCGILVRPHHERGSSWRRMNLAGLENIACWPRVGASPVDARSKADYFDSMYHAAVVVGLNTSAMIEAAILGRPVHTVLLPEFFDNQEGTVHFHYLLDGPDAHARDLAQVLEGHDADPGRSARFVRSFVRPFGVDTPATARVVDALEALAAGPAPAPVPTPAWTRSIRPLMRLILRPYADAAAERVRRAADASRRREAETLEAHRRRKEPDLREYRRQRLEGHRRRKRELLKTGPPSGGGQDVS